MDCLIKFFDLVFLKDLVSNSLATLLGVIFGIPIALFIARKTQEHALRKEEEAEQQEAKNRKTKILGLIQAELSFNLGKIEISHDVLGNFEPIEDRQRLAEGYLLWGSLKDETWRALSEGGEISWINDLTLSIEYPMHISLFVVP